ncbi:MAG: DUF4293 domain-containing protein [Bacteroidota bacterium]|nr:DUF4293 domain-containing protein [Bacteroidota bacterium]
MIQRIQTVFLLSVAIIAALLFVFPAEVYASSTETIFYTLLPFGVKEGTSPIIYGLFATNIGLIILAFVSIFQYKNRKKQLKTSRLLMLLSAMQVSLMFVFSLYNKEGYTKDYTWAAYLPLAMIVFSLLAGIFIKKDEELVRSADRIR